MILREFFSKPIDISANQKTRDLKKSVKSDELFWFIIDSDKLYKKHFFPISKQLNKNKNCDESKILELFMPMVKDGCKDYYSKNKLSGKLETVFPKNLRDEICHKLHDHYRDGLNKNEYKLNEAILIEGGNVSSKSPGWQGAADVEADEIDLKLHDREFMIGQLKTLLTAQNESFKEAYGRHIWNPKLLASGKMFSGSSLQFFDVKSINTQDFMNKLKKVKVGDIDTQIDQSIGEEVTNWLKSIIGKKIGNGTFLGFNSSLSSLWLLDDPPVRVQVDYELGPYDPETNEPTEWFAYSHSSHYDDMAAGIKGVFHKYINRAMTHAQSSTKYVARVLKKSVKISDQPVTDSDYSFAVSSAQGGGMSVKYKPYIDPATGQPMEKDGIPVMQLLEPKDRDYIQNLDQQFQINYGRNRTAADKKLQGSFVGTLQLMNKSFTPEQNENVARAFLDILFAPGAQMINAGDPERDRDNKMAAVDAMLLGGDGIKPLNLPDGKALRQEAVKMATNYTDSYKAKQAGKGTTVDKEVAEDTEAAAAAKPNYARQGIKHLYNRLPDGRVSSVEMRDSEFQEVAKEIAANGGTLNDFPINLKVDGAGIRFGKDSSGRPFFMTSKVTTPLYQDDVGYFTSFGQERGQDAEQLVRTKNYDDALALITGSKFIQTLPPDTIVQAEMLYNPMAEKTEQGLKFVNIPYDPKRLGKQMTLVPFMFKQYSTGEERPDADKIKKRLLAAGDSNIKIISNSLEQKGINVSKIIDPILDLDPKDKTNKPAFDKAKQELSAAIIDNPKLAGKDTLGDNMEGIVVNLPSGQLFKVTSQQMKAAMAAKMAQPGAKREGPLKTAVVAIGSFAGHRGHEELFNYTINKAKELGGDPYLFIGTAVGADDPIPPDVKVQTWHKLYPQYASNISTITQDGGTLMQKIKHELISPQPGKPPKYDNIVIMVGEDRKDMPIAGALMKAVNKFPGYEHVKASLEVTPRGTGMSFTKLRNILKDPNATPEQQYALWAQGFDEQKLGKDWILHLMDISRKGMGIVQQPTTQSVSETRLFNALIRPTKILSENLFNPKQPTLSQGDNGVEVKQLQWSLNSVGSNIGEIDGVFGKQTKVGVIDFQKKSNLAPDGIAGNKVFSSLNNALSQKGIKEFPPQLRTVTKKPGVAADPATAKKVAEKYLGSAISDDEWDMLIRATGAESSPDQEEQGYIMGVILNRVRSGKWGNSIESVLTAKNQFQAVTGTRVKPGPSPQYSSGPTPKRLNSLLSSAANVLPSVPKSYLYFTAANPAAYGKGTNIGFKDTLISRGGKQIGQTIFAA